MEVKYVFFIFAKSMNDKNDFQLLLDKDELNIPQVGDVVKGLVLSASKAEVRLDINGAFVGIVRGPELYSESIEYASLKAGDEIEAKVVEAENENGEVELSFRQLGQEKAWGKLREAFKDKEVVKVRIIDANKGGLLVRYYQISGFLPVSQLAPDNYPRIAGGDKTKILEKLKSFVGTEFDVNIITLDEDEQKIIFSEKDVWNKKQQHVLDKYKVGMVVDGRISAVTNFGVFLSFDENMEGLIHISELAWQRIDAPASMFRVGDIIKAEIVNIDGSKIFLSAKKIQKDPWVDAVNKYVAGQVVKGEILKVNPFGLFVKLDDEIHGLAHISQLELAKQEKINETFKSGEEKDFEIISISPTEHRLALKLVVKGKKKSEKKSVAEQAETTETVEEKPKKAKVKKETIKE